MSARFWALERATAQANSAYNGGPLPCHPAGGQYRGKSRSSVSLTKTCRDVIVGAILGDACLERNGKHVRLRIDHGHHQQALVEWKYRQLAELTPSPPRRVEVYDPRTHKTYIHFRFASRTIEALDEYFDLFYGSSGVKCVPENIATYLNSALSIAVWYMDDGGRRGDCRSGYFNT